MPCIPVTHKAVCLTTGPQPLPIRVLHRERSNASSFNLQYRLFTLKSFGSRLPLLPCLPVTSSLPFSHHPVSAYPFFLVFTSLLTHPFPLIQYLLTSSSLSSRHLFLPLSHHPGSAYLFFLSSRHFFSTPFPLSSICLRLLPCLPVNSFLPFLIIQQLLTSSSLSYRHFFPTLSHHPVAAYVFFLVFPSRFLLHSLQ